jgi:hypothetical protein
LGAGILATSQTKKLNKMKDLKQFKLIDGFFTAQDANTVLTALINYKVDYHNREDFSNHIRFNKDLDHSNKRVEQLESKNDLNSFLNRPVNKI